MATTKPVTNSNGHEHKEPFKPISPSSSLLSPTRNSAAKALAAKQQQDDLKKRNVKPGPLTSTVKKSGAVFSKQHPNPKSLPKPPSNLTARRSSSALKPIKISIPSTNSSSALVSPPPPPPSVDNSYVETSLDDSSIEVSSNDADFADTVRGYSQKIQSDETLSNGGSAVSSVWEASEANFREQLKDNPQADLVLNELQRALEEAEFGAPLTPRIASPSLSTSTEKSSKSVVFQSMALSEPIIKLTVDAINDKVESSDGLILYKGSLGEIPLKTLPSAHKISQMEFPESILELVLNFCAVTDDQFIALIKKLPHLQTVTLMCCPHLTDQAIKSLEGCSHLQRLNLSDCQNLDLKKIKIPSLPDLVVNIPQQEIEQDVDPNQLQIASVFEAYDEPVIMVVGLKVAATFPEATQEEADFVLENAKGPIFLPHYHPKSSSRAHVKQNLLTKVEAEEYIASCQEIFLREMFESYQKALAEYGIEIVVHKNNWLMADVLLSAAKNLQAVVGVIIQELINAGCYKSRLSARTYEELVEDLEGNREWIEKIRDLQLKGQRLTFIPKFLSHGIFVHLGKINLSGNSIYEIFPGSFAISPGLTVLSLAYNEIAFLPDLSEELSGIEYLNLSHNHLENLPLGFFEKWTDLQGIRLDHNHFSKQALEALYGAIGAHLLKSRKLYKKDPAGRCQPPFTRYVREEAENLLREFPLAPLLFIKSLLAEIPGDKAVIQVGKDGLPLPDQDLTPLHEAYARRLAFYHIVLPPEVQNLREMDLMLQSAYNFDRVFPALLKVFSGTKIDQAEAISPTAYAELLEWLHKNPKAHEQVIALDLSGRGLSFIPSFILGGTFSKVEALNVENNAIWGVGQGSFEKMAQLKSLNLNHNQINDLSDSVFKFFIHLEALTLSHNSLSRLPQNMGAFLLKLKVLDVTYNQLFEEFTEDFLDEFEALQLFNVAFNRFEAAIQKKVDLAIEARLKQIRAQRPQLKGTRPVERKENGKT